MIWWGSGGGNPFVGNYLGLELECYIQTIEEAMF